MKRLLSLALCVILVFGVVFPVYAVEDDNTELTQNSAEACVECGQTEGHTENCSQYVAPVTACAECGQTEGHADNCSQNLAPDTGCAECGQTEGHTENCSQYVAPVTACAECGQTEGHAQNCSQYVAPSDSTDTPLCGQCNAAKNEDGVIIHEKSCPDYVKTCTCTPVEGVHQEGCDFYVAPVDSNAALYEKLMATATMEEFDALVKDMTEEEQNAFAASLTEEQLQALRDHIQSIASKQGTPYTVVFTDAGPFMPAVSVRQSRSFARTFASTRDTVTDNGLELSKEVVSANDDGSFTIRMEAYTTGEVTTSTKTVPVDIVLVLDQSGSMAFDFSGNETNNNTARRQYAMKLAVNNFIGAVAEKYSDEADHRISIVTFGSNASTLQGWTFVDGSGKDTLQGKISGLPNSPGGATNVAAGMTRAESLMGSGYSYSGSNTQRQKVVIVFTDGVPTTQTDFNTDVATSAISSAKSLKDSGATVYTVGIFTGANPNQLYGDTGFDRNSDGTVGSDWSNFSVWNIGDIKAYDVPAGNRFLNYLSSNYKDASEIGIKNYRRTFLGIGYTGWEITRNFTASGSGYYLTANDSSSLNVIFQTISDNIQTANIDLGSSTRVVDTVSDYFVIPEDTSDIKLYTAAAKADGTFDSDVAAPVGVSAIRDSSGKTISVTGFDFNANFVSDKLKEDGTYGKKLVIEFNVVPEDGFLGGNDVPTNDWEQSAVYHKDGTEVEKFTDASGTPTVNVDIDSVSVTPSNMNVYLLTNLTGDQIQSMTSVKVGNIDLDFTATNYGLDTWQNEYVNISIEIKDKDGNIVTALNGLAEDQTYTITVMVTPKTDGSMSVGDAATSSSGSNSANIHVFAPEITWQDTVIEANQGPCYTQNFAGLSWFHLNGTQKTYSDSVSMIGQEPSLTYEYNPPVVDSTTNSAAPISTDSFVDVTVKLGSHDITSYVDFLHKCECDLQIPCQWTDTDHGDAKGAEFIVHVSTFNLTITKNGTQSIDQVTGESQSYIFHVTGPNGFKMDVVICGDGSKTIKNLPVGDYTITEEENWSWRYTAQPYTVKADSIKGGSATVTVENTRDNDKWLNGGAYVSNLFGKLKSGN